MRKQRSVRFTRIWRQVREDTTSRRDIIPSPFRGEGIMSLLVQRTLNATVRISRTVAFLF
jgi:hypothetical protein